MIEMLSLILAFLYSLFLFWSLYQWKKIPVSHDKTTDALVSVAVVIPMRNEEGNIASLLNSIRQQRYKTFEVVLCDDHSTDDTIQVVKLWMSENATSNFSLLTNDTFSKKDAITKAIRSTQAELIITTDADCVMNEHWISSIVSHYEKSNAVLIAGPVVINEGSGIFQKIQSIEYAGLTAMSAAAIKANMPMFCSGANLAFRRDAFIEVDGYANSKSVSGDDTQLLLKIFSRFPGKISFLKNIEALVRTNPVSKKTEFFEQRKRWASKVPNTLTSFTITIAALAWIAHLFVLIDIIYSVSFHKYVSLLIILLMITLSEYMLLKSMSNFIKLKMSLLLILVLQPLYALYITVVGIAAPFVSFEWKGRSIKT